MELAFLCHHSAVMLWYKLIGNCTIEMYRDVSVQCKLPKARRMLKFKYELQLFFNHLGPRTQNCATYVNEFTHVSTLTASYLGLLKPLAKLPPNFLRNLCTLILLHFHRINGLKLHFSVPIVPLHTQKLHGALMQLDVHVWSQKISKYVRAYSRLLAT